MSSPEEDVRVAELESRAARLIVTEEASFFVPGVIRGSRDEGRREFRLRSMRGEFLGRPIVTIPPEEGVG